jgi:hypothetical protein
MNKSFLTQIESTLDLYFNKKAPQLPANIKEAIVKYGPYITLVLLVLSLPFILGLLGLSALFMPAAALGGARFGLTYMLGVILMLVQLGLEVWALPGLFKRQKSGWDKLFYSSLVSVVYNLVSMNLFGLIIGAMISFYFLFQVRSYYK